MLGWPWGPGGKSFCFVLPRSITTVLQSKISVGQTRPQSRIVVLPLMLDAPPRCRQSTASTFGAGSTARWLGGWLPGQRWLGFRKSVAVWGRVRAWRERVPASRLHGVRRWRVGLVLRPASDFNFWVERASLGKVASQKTEREFAVHRLGRSLGRLAATSSSSWPLATRTLSDLLGPRHSFPHALVSPRCIRCLLEIARQVTKEYTSDYNCLLP